MGVLAGVLADSSGRAAYDDFWYSDQGQRSSAGVRVTADGALTLPAVFACVTAISEDIAKVPLQFFEDLGDRGNRPTTNFPLQDLLKHQPNDYQTAMEFREMLTAFALVRQFGIAEIIPGPRGPVDQLIPLHPDLVREERSKTGNRRFIYRDPKRDGDERTLLPEDAFVLRGKLSRSILDFARDNVGTALATERFQGDLFNRGARFQGVVSATKPIPDPIRKGLRKALDEYAIGGPRAGRPLLLEDGMTWQNAAMTGRDAQLIDNLRWGLLQVCRFFRVQPSKVQDLTDAHYAVSEQAAIDWVVDTILTWAIRWEQTIRRDLIIAKEKFYARHLLDGLLRGDTAARSAAYALAIQWGWMTRDEVRAKENLNPMGGGAAALNLDVGHGQPTQQLAGMLGPEGRGHLKLIASGVAERLVRREYAAVSKLAARNDAAGFREGVEAFYTEHADEIARDLAVPRHEALRYAREQRTALLADGPAVMETWLEERVAHLTRLALDKPEVAAAA